MSQETTVTIPGIPSALHWRGAPAAWTLAGSQVLTFSAGPRTDWFIDPDGSATITNAPALLTPVNGPCQLKARVRVEAKATFDAGVLVAYQSDTVWAKLCFELSPQGQLTIVSVVTKGTSDDCNSVPVSGDSIYLRLTKLEAAYAFHYSGDGKQWNLVRYFSLGGGKEAHIGFIVQSPTGNGCSAHFSETAFVPQGLKSIRSGE